MQHMKHELTETESQHGEWDGGQVYKAHKCHTTDTSTTPESRIGLRLGNKSALVKDRERCGFVEK